MKIAEILGHKGRGVVDIAPTDSLEAASQLMTVKGIGALVVRHPDGKLAGLLTERDIINTIAHRGPTGLGSRVADAMTREVITCKPDDLVTDLMTLITLRRVRHVPVMEAGKVIGIVSIGDVLKSRLEERALEVAVLHDLSLMRG